MKNNNKISILYNRRDLHMHIHIFREENNHLMSRLLGPKSLGNHRPASLPPAPVVSKGTVDSHHRSNSSDVAEPVGFRSAPAPSVKVSFRIVVLQICFMPQNSLDLSNIWNENNRFKKKICLRYATFKMFLLVKSESVLSVLPSLKKNLGSGCNTKRLAPTSSVTLKATVLSTVQNSAI